MGEAEERRARKWSAINGPYGWVGVWAAIVVFAPFTLSAMTYEWNEGRHASALVCLVSSCAMVVAIATVTRYVAYGKFHAIVAGVLVTLAFPGIVVMLLAIMGVVTLPAESRASFRDVWWVDIFWAVVLFLLLPAFFRQFKSVFKKSDKPTQSQ